MQDSNKKLEFNKSPPTGLPNLNPPTDYLKK